MDQQLLDFVASLVKWVLLPLMITTIVLTTIKKKRIKEKIDNEHFE